MKKNSKLALTEQVKEEANNILWELAKRHNIQSNLAAWKKLREMYDWSDLIVDKDGKKELRDAMGNIMVPAWYDDYAETYGYFDLRPRVVIAKKDGLWGLVKTHGSGQPVTGFDYDYMSSTPGLEYYLARVKGEEQCSVITHEGKTLIPAIVDKVYQCVNGWFCYESNGKCGAYMVDYDIVLPPVYDDIHDDGVDSYIEFEYQGKTGYVTVDETHRFLSKEEFEAMEDPGEVFVC